MLKIYCDTGGYRPELRAMSRDGRIELVQFRYENRNKHIKSVAPPSKPAFDEMNYAYNELGGFTYDDLGRQSSKIDEIRRLIGSENERDIKHLDSAYLAGCHAFITSDKGDICSKKEAILGSLGIRVFHFQEDWNEFKYFCASDR